MPIKHRPHLIVCFAAATALGSVGAPMARAGTAGRSPTYVLPSAQAAAGQLRRLIEAVPPVDTGRTLTHGTDDHGEQLGALDPIDDPAGGYLAVYHSPYRSPVGRTFKVSLGRSGDLVHWTRTRVLDGIGASMPTLRAIPGTNGYLLAYEKQRPRGDLIRIAYYPSRAALLAGQATRERDLPRQLSRLNNGTPTILSVTWRGGPARSLIQLGFHYQTEMRGAPGTDREAIGSLENFRRWRVHRDAAADRALAARALRGSHGDWRRLTFGGFRWRIYEAQSRFDDFGSWRVALCDDRADHADPLDLRLGDDRITSVGNPVLRTLTAPYGRGQVLAITAFVFAATSPNLSGELIYYQPV